MSEPTKIPKKREKDTLFEKELKRVPWQRLALSLIGIATVAGMWRWAVLHLYTIPEHAVVAFSSVTNNAFYVIAAIVVFMVSGKMIYDWKHQSATTLLDQAEHITQKIKEERKEERKEESVHVDIAIVKEAGINAPELKPFGAVAVGDEEEGEHNDFQR